jgi:hypothetical protein
MEKFAYMAIGIAFGVMITSTQKIISHFNIDAEPTHFVRTCDLREAPSWIVGSKIGTINLSLLYFPDSRFFDPQVDSIVPSVNENFDAALINKFKKSDCSVKRNNRYIECINDEYGLSFHFDKLKNSGSMYTADLSYNNNKSLIQYKMYCEE